MDDFEFRLVGEDDIPLLHEWLNRPHVAEWWGRPPSLEDVRRRYTARIDGAVVRCYIAYEDRRPMGFIQTYRAADVGGGWWEDVTDRGVFGLDQYLAEASELGRGVGRRMIGAFVNLLFRDSEVSQVQADPAPHNVRAIRCYEAVGFRKIGRITTPDGEALLMAMERPTA